MVVGPRDQHATAPATALGAWGGRSTVGWQPPPSTGSEASRDGLGDDGSTSVFSSQWSGCRGSSTVTESDASAASRAAGVGACHSSAKGGRRQGPALRWGSRRWRIWMHPVVERPRKPEAERTGGGPAASCDESGPAASLSPVHPLLSPSPLRARRVAVATPLRTARPEPRLSQHLGNAADKGCVGSTVVAAGAAEKSSASAPSHATRADGAVVTGPEELLLEFLAGLPRIRVVLKTEARAAPTRPSTGSPSQARSGGWRRSWLFTPSAEAVLQRLRPSRGAHSTAHTPRAAGESHGGDVGAARRTDMVLPTEIDCVCRIGRNMAVRDDCRQPPCEPRGGLSRQHCDVVLTFTRAAGPVSPPDRPRWRYDQAAVVDLHSQNGTAYRGVPLFPGHRYAFSAEEATAAAASSAAAADLSAGPLLLSLRIGSAAPRRGSRSTQLYLHRAAANSGVGSNEELNGGAESVISDDGTVQLGAEPRPPRREVRCRAQPSQYSNLEPLLPESLDEEWARPHLARRDPRGCAEKVAPWLAAVEHRAGVMLEKVAAGRSPAPTTRARRGKRPRADLIPGAPRKVQSTTTSMDGPRRPSQALVRFREDLSVVVVTTGFRLSAVDQRKCKASGIIVNPSMGEYHRASYLVAKGQLVRSIKLLTAAPYVTAVVSQQWLAALIAMRTQPGPTPPGGTVAGGMARNPSEVPPPEAYPHREEPGSDSLEVVNQFSLASLLAIPPSRRQALFTPHVLWIHPRCSPQAPPDNDMRSPILASGGVVSDDLRCATVVVMPSRSPTSADWRLCVRLHENESRLSPLPVTSSRPYLVPSQEPSALRPRHSNEWIDKLLALLHPSVLCVTPDDVFRCILQQRPITSSTVDVSSA